MSGLEISPAIPDLKVARVYPCSAKSVLSTMCGATPTSLYHRTCGVDSHEVDVYLCPVHAAIVASGGATCRECAKTGGTVPVRIRRVYLIPVRVL